MIVVIVNISINYFLLSVLVFLSQKLKLLFSRGTLMFQHVLQLIRQICLIFGFLNNWTIKVSAVNIGFLPYFDKILSCISK